MGMNFPIFYFLTSTKNFYKVIPALVSYLLGEIGSKERELSETWIKVHKACNPPYRVWLGLKKEGEG